MNLRYFKLEVILSFSSYILISTHRFRMRFQAHVSFIIFVIRDVIFTPFKADDGVVNFVFLDILLNLVSASLHN